MEKENVRPSGAEMTDATILARQERIAELAKQVRVEGWAEADGENWLRIIARSVAWEIAGYKPLDGNDWVNTATGIIQKMLEKLSCLRNEGGGDVLYETMREIEHYENHGLIPEEPASPSHLPAREAIERADEAMRQIWSEWFTFYQNHLRALNVAISAADQQAFYEIAQPVLRKLAALQPLSQGNGEAVGESRIGFGGPDDCNKARGARAMPINLPCLRCGNGPCKIDGKPAPTYTSPPSQPEGVREALEKAIEFIADEYKTRDYEDQGEWLPPTARAVHAKLIAALYGHADTTPSPGLVEAAEWQPIETAPKDGTPILIAVPNRHGWYLDCGTNFYDIDDRSEDIWIARESNERICGGAEPTHWMPLPEPPRTLSAKPTADRSEK